MSASFVTIGDGSDYRHRLLSELGNSQGSFSQRGIRCPMLRPDPRERRCLVEIRDNLVDRIAEAKREGWLGDVKGHGTTLEGAKDKLAQMDAQTASTRQSIYLGMPSFGEIAARA
ncbi:hypothetical protein AB0A98_06195 [Streptomyces chrestomyceticus]|uniref:hypothetical protein n=1 Tax=Streptomyces chrestomyceticus TaxID=68185 RepID=UPI00340860A0